jgi:hypothetical protein
MLENTTNSDMYPEWLASIQAAETRDAFCYLLGLAATSSSFICNLQRKGVIRDFRFIGIASRQQELSFITNQSWLLFYFRSPAIKSGAFSRDDLRRDFESFEENPHGEWTVKVRNISDVMLLSKHVQWD